MSDYERGNISVSRPSTALELTKAVANVFGMGFANLICIKPNSQCVDMVFVGSWARGEHNVENSSCRRDSTLR